MILKMALLKKDTTELTEDNVFYAWLHHTPSKLNVVDLAFGLSLVTSGSHDMTLGHDKSKQLWDHQLEKVWTGQAIASAV